MRSDTSSYFSFACSIRSWYSDRPSIPSFSSAWSASLRRSFASSRRVAICSGIVPSSVGPSSGGSSSGGSSLGRLLVVGRRLHLTGVDALAEQLLERSLEGRLDRHLVTEHGDDALQLGDLAALALRLDVERLHVEQRAVDRDQQQVPVANVAPRCH